MRAGWEPEVEMQDRYWHDIVEALDYAFQPIVDYETHTCFGFEALLRQTDRAGIKSVQHLMNMSYGANLLQWLNSLLIEKAIDKFIGLKGMNENVNLKLFFNLDSRILCDMSLLVRTLQGIYDKYDLPAPFICFEITEFFDTFRKEMDRFRVQNRTLFEIAIDDFGTGFSDIKLLYSLRPEYIKIDRCFIAGIDHNLEKRSFLSHIVKMAGVLGTEVVAEGVENEREFEACRQIGCKLVQGYFIQRPDVELAKLISL